VTKSEKILKIKRKRIKVVGEKFIGWYFLELLLLCSWHWDEKIGKKGIKIAKISLLE
jgi:hypothetical protein